MSAKRRQQQKKAAKTRKAIDAIVLKLLVRYPNLTVDKAVKQAKEIYAGQSQPKNIPAPSTREGHG